MDSGKSFSDRVSATMGQFLLKGYALLDQYCPACESPLMRDRDNRLHCISCTLREQDGTVKQQDQTSMQSPNLIEPEWTNQSPAVDGNVSSLSQPGGNRLTARGDVPATNSSGGGCKSNASRQQILLDKVDWALDQLRISSSVAESVELAKLLQTLLQNFQLLKDL